MLSMALSAVLKNSWLISMKIKEAIKKNKKYYWLKKKQKKQAPVKKKYFRHTKEDFFKAFDS